MLIVTGSVTARPENFEALLEASLAHVRRSRGEPGCLMHSVQVDCENPMRLVFVEHWADQAALAAHFKVPDSIEFVTAARSLAAEASGIGIWDATPVRMG